MPGGDHMRAITSWTVSAAAGPEIDRHPTSSTINLNERGYLYYVTTRDSTPMNLIQYWQGLKGPP